MQTLKTEIKEIVEIIRDVPEQFQAMCFEILLKDCIARNAKPPEAIPAPSEQKARDSEVERATAEEKNQEIKVVDLHVKARRFLERFSVDIKQINNTFYRKDDEFLPLYDDLQSTKMAESQNRLALLLALQVALKTGEFTVNVDELRSGCRDRKVLDQANFASNLKKSSFFTEEYTAQTKTLVLSEDGKKELAVLLNLLN